MIRSSFPQTMKSTHEENLVSLPKDEFNETYLTIQELLSYEVDPQDFIIDDPFLSASAVKVDLHKHLQSLYERMTEIKRSITPHTEMVTISFN